MSSEWDNTPWGGTAVAKAAIGPYVSRIEYGTPLFGLSRTPQKRYIEAQGLYQDNPWVRTAESVVTRRAVNLEWHLEDDADETIEEGASGIPGQALGLLLRPQANLDLPLKMTRRALWSITSRHMGLCGVGYWFLDQLDAIAKTPLGIVYVNPARVWPATDANDMLVGWVIDAKDEQGHGGTPLEIDELQPFYLDPPDFGYYPTGLAGAAWQKAQITNLADRHAAYTLGTGGRIPGIVSPKEGTIPDEAYKALVQEFRQINESPDAAKRSTVVRGPIEFTTTAADPASLLLVDLGKMNRDDIFAIWGVPPTQAGIPAQAGLNSGERGKYDEAALMQGSVHDRVIAIRETIQYGILDRFKKLGVTLTLEIEEPEFDDETPMYENAVRALNVPLTNAERRAIIGLDPFGDPALDDAIILPTTVAPFSLAPSSSIGDDEDNEGIKARTDKRFLGLRAKMDARFTPPLRKGLEVALAAQAKDTAARLREHPAAVHRRPGDTTVYWNVPAEDKRLAAVLTSDLPRTVARQISELLAPAKASPVTYEDAVVEFVEKRTTERIRNINLTTRDAIQKAVTTGIADGLSPHQIAASLADLPTFNAARAELVARTETMLAYNDAAVKSYNANGIEEVLAYDGDQDEECASRDGRTYPVLDAYDIVDHPNGTLDWAPVVKAAPVPIPEPIAPPVLRLEIGEPPVIPAPIVNVAAPEVHVKAADPAPAPIVNVAAPIVNVAPPDMQPVADMLGELKALLTPKPVQKIVHRNADGLISSIEERPA